MGGLLFLALIIAIGIAIANSRKNELNKLKEAYDSALKGNNKSIALAAGRAYYSAMRKGKLTIYDEQAIANDLSTMTI